MLTVPIFAPLLNDWLPLYSYLIIPNAHLTDTNVSWAFVLLETTIAGFNDA